ncbi:MAG: cellulase family glycosylhydrolase [Saprospiraceae bacterium]
MLRTLLKYTISLCIIYCAIPVFGQKNKTPNLVYVDSKGILRYTKDKKEAAFFGVNYTTPFAYGYRAHKRLGKNLEQSIDEDVYHLSRLGINAFRVHVWDVEISDSLGNLLDNEHLRLFDYLISKLKDRNIKTIITPLAFWGNGYPEQDDYTPGFSSRKGKSFLLLDSASITAQDKYLRQFFQHVNPYTKLRYGQDPDIIATEINNEPHHSGPPNLVTRYINQMAVAIRSTGWNKPIYYNISESPAYAKAVAKANIDGISFQWYPTNLVANHTQEGNYLPYVDKYNIPFGDSIPEVANKSKMVYEFDAADILQSNMYPTMARSFRTAGMQWATQFAYDPMATAFANTEYQTHYVNLAYTPSKAISLLIAGEAFRTLPLGSQFGSYPMDTLFGDFRVSYEHNLSEMNRDTAFYYSNTTATKPKSDHLLKHIVGVGSSPAVQYSGSGTYFLDRLETGVWRLELMPDAVFITDPFGRSNLQREISHIMYSDQSITIKLPDLGPQFSAKGLNKTNSYLGNATVGKLTLMPGIYLLYDSEAAIAKWKPDSKYGTLTISEYVAPEAGKKEKLILHSAVAEISALKPYSISLQALHLAANDSVFIQINRLNEWPQTYPLNRISSTEFEFPLPDNYLSPGLLQYNFLVRNGKEEIIYFPEISLSAKENYNAVKYRKWETFVAVPASDIVLFDPIEHQNSVNILLPDTWRKEGIQYVTSKESRSLILQLDAKEMSVQQNIVIQQFIGDAIKQRMSELKKLDEIKLELAIAGNGKNAVKINLILNDGSSFSALINPDTMLSQFRVPLNSLKADGFYLIPRPYPGFQPLKFESKTATEFNLALLDKIEVSTVNENPDLGKTQSFKLQLGKIFLSKNDKTER